VRFFPQTDNIEGMVSFGIRRYNQEQNRLDIKLNCLDYSPERTDSLADQCIIIMEGLGFIFTGAEDTADSQKGVYQQQIEFSLLTHNGYDRIEVYHKVDYLTSGTEVKGLYLLENSTQKKEIIQKKGGFTVGPTQTEEILKRGMDYGFLRVAGKRIEEDGGQNLLIGNWALEAPFFIEVGSGALSLTARASVVEIKQTIDGFEAGIKLLGEFD
jgi:hypothetical protein